MLPIILEAVNSLKICLLIALFTGFIFGYLYTNLKARERYHPDIKKFMNSINYYTQSLKKADNESQKLKGEIESFEYTLKGINQSVSEYKESSVFQKSFQGEIIDKSRVLKTKYEEKKSILGHYSGEIEKVKKECRLDDVSNISENRESMQRLIGEKKLLLKEKRDKFSMIQQKIKGLDLDNLHLEEKFHELGKRGESMALRIKEKEDDLNSLEHAFIKEYELLYKEISASQDRVKEFKKKLKKLKDNY